MAMLKRLLMVLVAVLLIAVPASLAQGAPGGGPGRPPDAGQGGGGGGNPNKGPGQKLGDLYADLAVVARDSDGLPITIDYEVGGLSYTCVQPITFWPPGEPLPGSGDTHDFAPFDFTGTTPYSYGFPPTPYRIPLAGDTMTQSGLTAAAEVEDETELAPCDVAPEGLLWVSEVDLGRLNLGRAPVRVLRKQLDDVEAFLRSGEISLDASGRFTIEALDATLDSPLANMAAYEAILETGVIGTEPIPNGLPLTEWALTAAELAAAAPKEDFVITVDTVQYLNRILSVPADTDRDTHTGDNYLGADLEEFLDFEGVTFLDGDTPTTVYSREDMFPGNICFLDPTTSSWIKTSIQAQAFDDPAVPGLSGIAGYVEFAEDAHQVLVEVHRLGINVDFIDSITEETPLDQIACPAATS